MSPAEDRIAEDAAKRGAMLPPTPPDAVQRKTVSREASVTPGKSPARSPHPKAWDASFAKVPAPTLDEASASSSRDRAERVNREKHAHMEARAELLSLIAEAAADADVLGEAFPVIEGDVPGAASVRVALPPPRLAMREIKERRDRERAAEADRARRAEALEKLRKQQRETAAALRERRRADPAAAPTPAAEKKHGGGTRGAAGVAGEKENETERDISGPARDPLESRADREEAARRAEVQAFIAESKARWRVKLAQEKTAARLREQRRLEVLKQERAAAREAAREHAAAREAAGPPEAGKSASTSGGPAWDTTPADETETATGKKESSETGAPPTPVRRVGVSPAAAAAAAEARETRNRTSAALGRFGVSEHAARAGIASSSSGTIPVSQRLNDSRSRDAFLNPEKEKGKARVARTSARASAELKKRWMEDEARARSAREAAVSGSSLGGSAFVDTAIGARVAEERRLRGEEAKERLRAEIEARLEAAKRAARAAAEDARAAAEKAAPTRGGAAALAAAASAAASAVARRGGQRDRVERTRVTRVPTVSRASAEPAPDAKEKSPAKSALKKTTPTKSPGAETSAAETSASARHISFAATVRESDGAEKPMSMPGGSEEPEETSEESSEASGTRGFGGNRGETEGADDFGAPEDSPADDSLRSRPRLLERMRGPPSTRTVLPGDEHVPRAEDWLGMGQGGGAGRIARRLAKRRAPRDPDAPPLEPPDSREAAEAMKAKAFRATLPRDSSARRADIVADEDVVAARLAAERSRTQREPRGVLSTYARRTFASLVAPAEAEPRAGTELDRAAQNPTLSLVSSTSAQTDPMVFVGDRGRSKEIPPETSPAPENRAGRRKKPSAKKNARASRANAPEARADVERIGADRRVSFRRYEIDVDVASASDGTSDDLDFVPDASRNPLDKRAAFLAACLAEEEAAASAKRQSPDALESRFESELALFEEMGDIAAELDAMRFARDAFDAEQAASRLAAVAESRRVELLGARRTLDAAREAADEYEALTKADGGDDSSAATFTERDIARVAEAITEKMREESLAHLKEVTDAFLADVARGRKDAGEVAAASLRARLSEGSGAEGSAAATAAAAAEGAAAAAVATEPVAELPVPELPVPELPVPELPSEAAPSGDPEQTSDSIVDEVGGVVPDASRLSESFVPEDSGLFSDDDAVREVEAKHEDVQRRLRDMQRKLKTAELDAKRRRIAEMESRLVELEAAEADAEKNAALDFRATEAETAAMADEAESRDLDARLEAHGARVARLEALVEKRRLENLSLRKLTGKETTLREEMKRLDASIEKQTRTAAAAARDAEDSGKKAPVSPRVPRLDLSAASPASTTTRSPSPSPIAQAPDAGGSTSPGSSDAEQVDSESLPEPPESDAASEVSTEPDFSRVGKSPTADAPPSSARAKHPPVLSETGFETISPTPPPRGVVHTTPGFEALVRSASARLVDAATRAALDASGATSRGLDANAAAALESERAFAAIEEIAVHEESLLREHGEEIDRKLLTEACVAARKSLPARLLRDAVVETVRDAFPNVFVFESAFGKELSNPPGSSVAGAFTATSALAAAVGGGGLKGERLVDVVAARARAALTASDNAFPASEVRNPEAAEAAEEISAEMFDAGGAETPLDAVVRADARESDDLGWYAVRAVEKAVATRLADELFDELVADTVLALVGVGETTSSGARRR